MNQEIIIASDGSKSKCKSGGAWIIVDTKMKKYVTEYIKTKEFHKNLGYIINDTTFVEDVLLTKNSQAIGKSVKSPNPNNIISTTTSTSSIKVSTKMYYITNKYFKSPKETTQNKPNSRKNKTNKNRKNNIEVDTNVDDETDNHLLINKTKLSNDKNNKLSTRKGKKGGNKKQSDC